MSSKRDLVEAHGFNRRRLVTAFVSGAPGGREVEPVRYGRAIVGGLVLALIVVAGAAVGGLIKPRLPDGWDDNGLVIAEDEGSRFIAQGGRLFPVVNTTSARLLIGTNEGDLKVTTVSDDLLADMRLDVTVGIVGAPDRIPTVSQLINNGWTACTSPEGGLRVTISTADDVTSAAGQARLVQSTGTSGARFVVADGRRYPVAEQNGDNVVRELGLPGDAFPASDSWLNLLAVGPEVRPFAVPDQGERIDTGIPGLQQVGTPVTQGGNRFLLVQQGGEPRLLPVSEFAYDVYVSGGPGAEIAEVDDIDAGELAALPNADPVAELAFLDAWPAQAVEPYRDASPCVRLSGDDDFRSSELASVPDDSERLPSGDAQDVVVQRGYGALVQESSGEVRSDQAGAVLIDSTGARYAVPAASLGKLGYGSVAPPAVDQAWTVLFQDGPTLSVEAANTVVTAAS